MADQLQDIVQRMIAAGEPEANIALVIRNYQPPAAAPTPEAPGLVDGALADNPALPALLRGTQGLLRVAKRNPVATGATVGGALATGGASIPAQIALAALGAAGGAGFGRLAQGAQSGDYGTPSENAKLMAAEGVAGAAGQGLGAGAAKLLKAGGKLVYKTALRPSMGLQREFGDVAETGLREGARVSQGGERAIGAKLGQSGAKAKQMIADAHAAGASPVTIKEVASEFGDVFKQGREVSQLGLDDPRPAVVARLKAMDAKNPGGIALDRAQDLKSRAQDLASKAYRAEDLGHPINSIDAASNKATAAGLRKGIEARVPGIADVNAHSQELIGVLRALEDANRRNVPGVGSLRSLLGDFIPSVSSTGGILADRVGRSGIVPASFRTALIAALSGGQE